MIEKKITQLIEKEIKKIAQKENPNSIINNIKLEVPPKKEMGDYAFPCFSLSKELKKSPAEISKNIADALNKEKSLSEIISKAVSVGPYVNMFINETYLARAVLKAIFKKKENYGKGSIKKKTLLVEGWQPNTHKAFHIGHIRNAVLSESLCRIFEYFGYKVIRTSYMGDIGAHVAKWIWYYKNHYKGEIPKKDVTKWAGELYTKATQLSKEKEEYKEEINEVHAKLEQGDKELTKIWKVTRELCLKDLWKIIAELGSWVDRKYYESEVEKPGIKKVKELLRQGYAELSDGAIIMDLKKYGLGVFVLLKSNGASLYSTKDIALAYLKSKEFNFDESLYIVASEQDHHFRQLFKTLEIIKYKDAKKLKHISYGLVKLQEGKMSSRMGNIILYEDFRDRLEKSVSKLIEKRHLSPEQKKKIIRGVAFAAMKFTMLSQDSHREIIFDYEKSLSFDGETGPYVQYTYARLSSILRKYNEKSPGSKIDGAVSYEWLDSKEEKELIKILAGFPEAVKEAALEYKPNIITRYALDLCQAFNRYYHMHQILQENKDLEKARILLAYSVKIVIKTCLNLLGIDALEVM